MTPCGAVLVVFGGWPGVGKTTIARALATRMRATYLRIDTIEQAIRDAGVGDVGSAGYQLANRIADENLRLGLDVVADCVNPVSASRDGWRQTASMARARIAEIRVICSDEVEHRRRLETRVDDVPGLARPSWDTLAHASAEPWDGSRHLLVDSASVPVADAVERCLRYVENCI